MAVTTGTDCTLPAVAMRNLVYVATVVLPMLQRQDYPSDVDFVASGCMNYPIAGYSKGYSHPQLGSANRNSDKVGNSSATAITNRAVPTVH